MSDLPPWTVIAVARRLKLSEDRIRQLANSGALPSMRTESGIRLFKAEDVERFATLRAEQRNGSDAA